jgi:hypothetical protein
MVIHDAGDRRRVGIPCRGGLTAHDRERRVGALQEPVYVLTFESRA